MYKFFAYMGKMKYIERWGLMHSVIKENILEHSAMVAMVAHALGSIANNIYGEQLDVNSITVKALFHETSEVLTGDLPTPIKYLNDGIRKSYKEIEAIANNKLLEQLPQQLVSVYQPIVNMHQDVEHEYVKYADKLCAYIKCIEEVDMGNKQFVSAYNTLKQSVELIDCPAVKYFVVNMIVPFGMTLDQLTID